MKRSRQLWLREVRTDLRSHARLFSFYFVKSLAIGFGGSFGLWAGLRIIGFVKQRSGL